jgi:hypothetical protein
VIAALAAVWVPALAAIVIITGAAAVTARADRRAGS